ncbi:MAG: AAA family ATPase [Lachnospiraceae bacterium]|nr:AAA family ATPase [Lachnospiraceae bacterium]
MSETEFGLAPVIVDRVVSLLSHAYIELIRKGEALSGFPSVMLWGPPGVGKSQAVREIARTVSESTGKKAVVTDVRLLLFNPVDLRGIPTANEDRTLAVWLKPRIFQMEEGEDTVNLLFLDEISAAPPSVQAAAYQITLDRRVGEHKLPDNCIVLAAGNRITDRSVAYNMPKALSNRLCHFEVSSDAASWHRWAIRSGIHPYVLGYLDYNPSDLMRFDPSGLALAFPTPRTWEMVSRILSGVSPDVPAVMPMLEGCIGRAAAGRFLSWSKLYRDMPDMETIFSGEGPEPPEASELQMALRSAMVAYAASHPVKDRVDASLRYACRLPVSFRRELMEDYSAHPALQPILEQNELFREARRDGLQ